MQPQEPLPPPDRNNPVNINIQFNINNQRGDIGSVVKGRKIGAYPLQLQPAQCQYQLSKTPQLPNTDRIYSHDLCQKGPTRKKKRNSMDISVGAPKSHTNQKPKNMTKPVFKKGELLVRGQLPKKKRNLSKNQGELFKKSFLEGTKSVFEARSEKKTTLQKSLKHIIHKIVNSQLSRRSLQGTSSNKAKSPYNPSTPPAPLSTRKKPKRKQGPKSERGGVRDETFFDPPVLVQQLNSLRSMTNSVLRSEWEELQLPDYSKKRRIHIKTDRDIDLIEEIAEYQRKGHLPERKRAASVNQRATKQTNMLIQTYINWLGDEESVESKEEPEFIEELEPVLLIGNAKEIRDILKQQVGDLFNEQKEKRGGIAEPIPELPRIRKDQLVQQGQIPIFSQQKSQPKSDQSHPHSDIRPQDGSQLLPCHEGAVHSGAGRMDEPLRPFLSSEMQRDSSMTGQLERLRLQELKKQEIEKWGYLLEFIKKNLGGQADSQAVLNEVCWFLQRSKSDLQKQMGHQKPKNNKEIDEFTGKYSENREDSRHKDYYRDSQDEDVNSFKEEYTEENEELKMLNLDTISGALRDRQKSIQSKREKQLRVLEDKRETEKISSQEYQKERAKVEKWTKKELAEISRARKNIWRGYNEAKGILEKTANSRLFEERGSTKKMMKCLSQTYLGKGKLNYRSIAERENRSNGDGSYQSDSSYRSQEEEESSDHYQEDAEITDGPSRKLSPSGKESLSPDVSAQLGGGESMEAIAERLQRMKHQHFTGDEPEEEDDDPMPDDYPEMEKSAEDDDYSDEEKVIIDRQKMTFNNFSSLATKLKYCCTQDKEDIFEFIFLDMCIELYQEPCNENRIMKSINKHVAAVQAQAKKKKGVKTNLNVVKEYLKRFTSFLTRTNKQCLAALRLPMGPSALEMLRYMHDSDYNGKEEEEQGPTLIIPITVFEKFQQNLLPTLEFQQYYEDTDKEEARITFLKTIMHIHNKALFDSLNELLDHQRPFGIWGKPFPWKKSSSFPHKFTEDTQQNKLQRCVDKVIEQCSYVCGLLVDKEDSLVGSAKISDAYVEQIREDRLSRMLANELVESEERWLFYDDEETEVLVEIGSYVWNLLLYQARSDVYKIIMDRRA